MKTLNRQKLDVVNKMRSNIFGWRWHFTPDSKHLEFERFGNCGEFATNKRGRNAVSFNPVEFDGIRNLDRNHFIQPKP
jgi:hypothetical protein